MNLPLLVAGALGVIGAGVHGVAGQVMVVRRLTLDGLPSTSFGGARATRAMIQITWHLTTVGFLAVGVALLLAGSVLEGAAAQAVAVLCAATATGFATVATGLGVAGSRSPRSLLNHPGPPLLIATAALAWLGAF